MTFSKKIVALLSVAAVSAVCFACGTNALRGTESGKTTQSTMSVPPAATESVRTTVSITPGTTSGKTDVTEPQTSSVTTAIPVTAPAPTTTVTVKPPVATTTAIPPVTTAGPKAADFVRVRDFLPGVIDDLKYATDDNFTKTVIYTFDEAYLRYGTVEKLMKAAELLAEKGYGIKIWDAFRPPSAQFRLWQICPDPVYVADPNRGFSSHSRGNTIDMTVYRLADLTELEMPTGFDDFSKKADRDYSDVDAVQAENAKMLEEIMKQCGFKPYYGEWWHFSDADSYPVENSFLSDKVTK